MTPEEHYKEVVKLDMDKFDKKAPKFDYYDLIEFADSYHKKQLTLTDVSICLERAKKYARHQHFLGTQGKELVEFDDWKAKDW